MATSTLPFGRKYKSGVSWMTAIVMASFHVGAVAALFYVNAGAILTAVLLWIMAGMLGIGMGYHRLLTHRGYKTYRWVEYFLTWCATLALEGGPIFWVATHRVHHQKSDKEGDPHTPREGGWWAHMGWIVMGQGLHADSTVLARYVPDLARDPFHVWISTWHWTTNIVVGLLLLAFGGIPFIHHVEMGRDSGFQRKSAEKGFAKTMDGLDFHTARHIEHLGKQRPRPANCIRIRAVAG